MTTESYPGPRPTQVFADYWIGAVAPKESQRAKTERCGKWLVFAPTEHLDATWALIRSATEAGTLGFAAKTATTRPNPNA